MEDPSLPGRQSERPGTYDHELPRRLVVCLDGTWNQRDAGTNVYHLSNLVQEGRVKDEKTGEWFQIIYYDEGVGTGILDGVTGGAFGIGLSENIRQAYDWLVEKYRSGSSSRPDDEIYIFGFSRGAFTARSLVGLIAKCGLLYRGAPIPPAQLWEAYRILGRHRNPRTNSIPSKNWWEEIRGRSKQPFRLIRGLQRDAWEEPDAAPEIEPAQYRTEQLLLHWSRRVKITCLGVFDTVGSMGVDALAIPWLRSKTAQFHDTYLSSLIINAFHALAIDEHRANFPHIPWNLGADSLPGKTPGGGSVEQRWFIGAHSNIGGGYPDNMLAQYPLAWMIEKCSALKLVFRNPLPGAPNPGVTHPPPSTPSRYPDYPPLLQRVNVEGMASQPPQVRDSFADIARGIWQGLIRSKREYRRIGPPAGFQNGIPVRSANETVDDSVVRLMDEEYQRSGNHPRYNPPNLWEFWERTKKFPVPPPPGYEKPRHRYIEGFQSLRWLFRWLVLVGAAALALAHLRNAPTYFWYLAPAIAMAGALLLDWRESARNHAVAMEPDGVRAERRNALMTLALLLRLIILGFILFGLGYWISEAWPWIRRLDHSGHLCWLLSLDGLLILCGFTATWCAAPMLEAGFGSIVDLQWRRTVEKVTAWLNQWGDKIKGTDGERRQLLMPVAHTIYRDIFAFIPAYGITLFLANLAAHWCWSQHLSSPQDFWGALVQAWPRWSLYIVLGIVLADLLEDFIHLSYIKKYPKQPPSSLAVGTAYSATVIKFALLSVASLGLLAAIVCLACDQIRRLWRGETGGLSVVALVLTVLLLIPPVKALIKKAVSGGESTLPQA